MDLWQVVLRVLKVLRDVCNNTFEDVSFWPRPWDDKGCLYVSLFTLAITVIYTSEFLEYFKYTAYERT